MKHQKRAERLQESLRQIDGRWLREAYLTDSAEKLKRLKRAERSAKSTRRTPSPVVGRVATVAACLLLVVGLVLGIPAALQNISVTFLTPTPSVSGTQGTPSVPDQPITPNQPSEPDAPSDPSEPDQPDPPSDGKQEISINSLDKLNYYSAVKLMEESLPAAQSMIVGAATSRLPAAQTLSSAVLSTESTESLSKDGKVYYKVDPNQKFTITKTIYFQVELKRETGFLASEIGMGIVDVVITENDLDTMITFKNGDRFYSCLWNSSSEYSVTFSTHKYIEGFYLVKNPVQVNFTYEILLDGDRVVNAFCNYFGTPTEDGDITPDQIHFVEGSDFVSTKTETFTVTDLEAYFNRLTVDPDDEPPQESDISVGLEGLEFISNGDETCYVCGFENLKSADVVIPAYSPDGDRVTGIGSNAFWACTEMTGVVIPEGVTEIADYAFYECTSLASVTFPSTLTQISNNAFNLCESLLEIDLPHGLTWIGNFAFSGCSALRSVALPQELTHIGTCAFGYCEALSAIEIPNGITEIGNYVFSGCTGLEETVIPDSVTSIGKHAFAGCEALKRIEISRYVTSIGEGAFSSCAGVETISVAEGNPIYRSAGDCLIRTADRCLILGCQSSVIPADGSVEEIHALAFMNCKNLKRIVIPDSVLCIDAWAFTGCQNLVLVMMSDRVTSIGEYAFANCEALTVIELPATLQTIGTRAFYKCGALGCFIFDGTVAAWNAVYKVSKWDLDMGSYTVYCTDGTLEVE